MLYIKKRDERMNVPEAISYESCDKKTYLKGIYDSKGPDKTVSSGHIRTTKVQTVFSGHIQTAYAQSDQGHHCRYQSRRIKQCINKPLASLVDLSIYCYK